jgi:hypothetical protein
MLNIPCNSSPTIRKHNVCLRSTLLKSSCSQAKFIFYQLQPVVRCPKRDKCLVARRKLWSGALLLHLTLTMWYHLQYVITQDSFGCCQRRECNYTCCWDLQVPSSLATTQYVLYLDNVFAKSTTNIFKFPFASVSLLVKLANKTAFLHIVLSLTALGARKIKSNPHPKLIELFVYY